MCVRGRLALLVALLAVSAMQVSGNPHPEIGCYQYAVMPCHYRVGKKEWLGKIADRFGGVMVSDLLALNPQLEGAKTAPSQSVIALPCQRPAISADTVMKLLEGPPDMTVTVRAIYAAGLDEALSDPRWVGTLFAPSNCAWKYLLADLDITEAMLLTQDAMLDTVLQYHIVEGSALRTDDLHDGRELVTQHGQPLEVRQPAAGRYRVLTQTERAARVVQRNLRGGYARVHVVSEVMLPTREPPPEALMTKRKSKK